MLERGAHAPDFVLPGVQLDRSTDIQSFSLSETIEDGPALLNFYLFDFNPACRQHVCELHDLSWFDLDSDITVFGISTDGSFSHREFAQQEGLEYPLLSDTDGSVAESYGVLHDEFRGHRRIARRSVFVVDRDGTIQYSWASAEPDDQPEWDEIKAAVDAVK